MRKLAVVATLIVGLALSSVALAAGTLSGTYKTKVHTTALGGTLNGTWTIAFKRGGYTVTDKGKVVLRGKYSIKASKVSLTDKSGADKCSGTGIYKFKLKGNALKFTKVSDTAGCAGRETVLSGGFTKIS